MNRAHSLFEVKGFDDETREIQGIATTPTPDRMGDIVEPKGAVFKLPIPLLWQHRSDQPIGHVVSARVTRDGISVSAKLAKVAESGTLKDRLDEAWQSLKTGLVRGLSIGFNPIGDPEKIENTYSYKFSKWEWLELSAVTIPANADASIQTVKAFDSEWVASDRDRGIVRLDDEITRRVRRARKGAVYL